MRRQRYLPSVAAESSGFRAVWLPVLNAQEDAVHFRRLVEAMQRFGRLHEKVQQHPERYKLTPARATLGYGDVELQYLHKTNQLSLKIRLRGGIHAAIADA